MLRGFLNKPSSRKQGGSAKESGSSSTASGAQGPPSKTIDDLPDDLLSLVLGMSQFEDRLRVVPFVCKRWAALLRPEARHSLAVWRDVRLTRLEWEPCPSDDDNYSDNYGDIYGSNKELKAYVAGLLSPQAWGGRAVDPARVVHFSQRHGGAVERLEVEVQQPMAWPGMIDNRLGFRYPNAVLFLQSVLPHVSAQRLRVLRWDRCPPAIVPLLARLTSLESLSINIDAYCGAAHDSTLAEPQSLACLGTMPNLTRLELRSGVQNEPLAGGGRPLHDSHPVCVPGSPAGGWLQALQGLRELRVMRPAGFAVPADAPLPRLTYLELTDLPKGELLTPVFILAGGPRRAPETPPRSGALLGLPSLAHLVLGTSETYFRPVTVTAAQAAAAVLGGHHVDISSRQRQPVPVNLPRLPASLTALSLAAGGRCNELCLSHASLSELHGLPRLRLLHLRGVRNAPSFPPALFPPPSVEMLHLHACGDAVEAPAWMDAARAAAGDGGEIGWAVTPALRALHLTLPRLGDRQPLCAALPLGVARWGAPLADVSLGDPVMLERFFSMGVMRQQHPQMPDFLLLVDLSPSAGTSGAGGGGGGGDGGSSSLGPVSPLTAVFRVHCREFFERRPSAVDPAVYARPCRDRPFIEVSCPEATRLRVAEVCVVQGTPAEAKRLARHVRPRRGTGEADVYAGICGGVPSDEEDADQIGGARAPPPPAVMRCVVEREAPAAFRAVQDLHAFFSRTLWAEPVPPLASLWR